MSGILYIVATPIGNLSDMTSRAIETLRNADLIAAEDTRNTMKLLNHFDIHTKMAANHKFNEHEAVDYFVNRLLNGENIALVSDAGTPCVNDPGFVLCEACRKAGIEVIGIPGACAAVTALSISGLPSATFNFKGFFPREKKERISELEKIKKNPTETYIFYESPKRILDVMEVIKEELPKAEIALCNDLTKSHEKTYRGNAESIYAELKNNPNAEKGEYAMVLHYENEEPPEEKESLDAPLSLEAMLVDVMVKENCTMKEAITLLSSDASKSPTGKIPASKKEIYTSSLNLKELF